jgi:hypothetical protein
LKHIFVISALVLCVCGLSRPAQAQIYSWKDANGIMVLSNVPHNGASVMTMGVIAWVSAPLLMRVNSTYDPLIREHSMLQGVRADLVRAVILVESAFNPRALSPKGAMGLMQLMPTTAARFGVVDAFNRYGHNEELALAAYNAGPLAVDRHGSQIPPYAETRNYVKRIIAIRGTAPSPSRTEIFKSVEVVNGQSVIRYSNTKPASGDYQEVRR